MPASSLLARRDWGELPAIAMVAGSAEFSRRQIIDRFARELFGCERPEIARYSGPPDEAKSSELPLGRVLDDLRTPSFIASRRLVVVDRADRFVKEHRDVLLKHVGGRFSGGHLILSLEAKPDSRTKFVKAVAATGWCIECRQPYDRPPPWDSRTPAWDSELSHWVVARARERNLSIQPRTAFALHDRAGTDLARLDEEIEKIATYLAERGSREVTPEVVIAVSGDLREDSLFALADRFLEGRRREAVESVERLLEHGYRGSDGNLVRDPAGILLPLVATLVHRLRALRRAHAIAREGGGRQRWLEEGLVQKPFLDRFVRQIRAVRPARIEEILERLYHLDLAVKKGADPRRLLLAFVAG